MAQELTPPQMLAALDWQIELGADEAILDAPQRRWPSPDATERGAPGQAPASAADIVAETASTPPETDPIAEARHAAAQAASLEGLQTALAAYPHCELRQGAKSLVFADGDPAARVMVIGEAPGRDEDIQGKPFVGRAGQLLDRMFAAIGLGRATADPQQALYITNILPWRPPQNRDPTAEEIAMLRPFVERHIELVTPAVIVLMGNHACQALLGRRGITRLRGQWHEVQGRPALPMFHPAYLLRNPLMKRETWADLQNLAARL